MTSHPEQTLRPPARAWCVQTRGCALCPPPSPDPASAPVQRWSPRGPASWSAQPLGNPGAVRRTLQEMCLSATLSPIPPPPSTADSSHPSIGLTCFHGNWNPGLLQPLVLPPVITSSLKCKASSPGALGCAERSFIDGVKKGGRKRGKGSPRLATRTGQAGGGSFGDWERKERGCKATCLPFRISSRPQLEATATSATFYPAFNEGRGRGRGRQQRLEPRRQLCGDVCWAVRRTVRRGLTW